MQITQFPNSVFNSNTFVIHDGEQAVIVDLGDFQPVKDYLEKNGLTPVALLVTHVHYDHIYGIPEFMKAYPETPIYTSELGKESFNNPKWNFSRYHDDPISIDSPQIHTIDDGEALNLLGTEFKAIHTPGHDHSCITYQAEDNLFTGDSYIPDIKVVDTFPKSNKALAREWYDRLQSLTSDFNIYPGHGEIKKK